jgi:hypothetical protein
MGACLSSSNSIDVTEDDKRKHREAERELKEVSPAQPPAPARTSD